MDREFVGRVAVEFNREDGQLRTHLSIDVGSEKSQLELLDCAVQALTAQVREMVSSVEYYGAGGQELTFEEFAGELGKVDRAARRRAAREQARGRG